MNSDGACDEIRIEPLSAHRALISMLVGHLHREWHDFSPWTDPTAIERRLQQASGESPFPYTAIAISASGAFLGTGSIKLNELPSHPDKTHWLGEVYVPALNRGRGIGTRLIEHLLDYCWRHDVRFVYLYTPDQQALYIKLGWRECGEQIVDGERVSIMVREIPTTIASVR